MKSTSILTSAFLLLLLSAPAAYADINGSGLLDTILNRYETSAQSWASTILNAAEWLFWVLAVINLVWTGINLAFKQGSIAEFFGEFVRFIIVVGLFYWLLTNSEAIAGAILASLKQLGSTAGNVAGTTPSSLMDVGFNLVQGAFDNSSIWSPLDSLLMIAGSFIVLLFITLISLNLLILSCASWLLLYAGMFLLAFGGAQWTRDIAISYYKKILSIAIEFMAMILLIGIGTDILNSFISQAMVNSSEPDVSFQSLLTLIISSLILFFLTNKIPPMLSSIVGAGGSGAFAPYGGGTAMAAAGFAGGLIGGSMGASINKLKEAASPKNADSGQSLGSAIQNFSTAASATGAGQATNTSGSIAPANSNAGIPKPLASSHTSPQTSPLTAIKEAAKGAGKVMLNQDASNEVSGFKAALGGGHGATSGDSASQHSNSYDASPSQTTSPANQATGLSSETYSYDNPDIASGFYTGQPQSTPASSAATDKTSAKAQTGKTRLSENKPFDSGFNFKI